VQKMYSLILAALVVAVSAAFPFPAGENQRPYRVTLGVDCELASGGSGPGPIGPLDKQCLWDISSTNHANLKFCISDDGIFRGDGGSGGSGGTGLSGCTTDSSTPDKKRNVEEHNRAEAKILVPFSYFRLDEKFNEKQVSCAPEIRLLVDNEIVAHTDGHYNPNGVHWTQNGEGEFRAKLSLTKHVAHEFTLQYRDGADCDDFGDVGHAEKRTWATFDVHLSPTCTRGFTKEGKRNVLEAEEVESSSSSSSGTLVSATHYREGQRYVCVQLNQAILMKVVRNHHDSDDDDSDDDDE